LKLTILYSECAREGRRIAGQQLTSRRKPRGTALKQKCSISRPQSSILNPQTSNFSPSD